MRNLYPFVDVNALLSGFPGIAGFVWALLGVGRLYYDTALEASQWF